MTSLTILVMAFTFVMCFGKPAFAQHGRGFGGGVGRGYAGGMINMPGGANRGHSSSEMASPSNPHSQQNVTRGNMEPTGNKTPGDLLSQNTKLSSNLEGLLPAGTNARDAAQGFDHLGQFVAAVHVSHNLGIPFDQLKAEMTNGSSLGEAIHKLRPHVDARQQAIKANQQAIDDMENSMTKQNVTGWQSK